MIVRVRALERLLESEAYREGGAGEHAGGVHDMWLWWCFVGLLECRGSAF